MVNPEWGALGFLTKQPAPEIASEPEAPVKSSDAELGMTEAVRMAEASKLPHSSHGYVMALKLDCWLSKSRKGGAVTIESMDAAYIKNTMKMIDEGRHPIVNPKKDALLAGAWMNRFEKELVARGEMPF